VSRRAAERREAACDFVTSNPGCTTRDVAERINVPYPAATRVLKALSHEGRIYGRAAHSGPAPRPIRWARVGVELPNQPEPTRERQRIHRASNAFGSWMRAARARAGVDQAALETRIGKGAGYICRIESGAYAPPERVVCDQIDAALGLPVGATWMAGVVDRLRHLDSDLAEWVHAGGPTASAIARAKVAEARVADLEARLARAAASMRDAAAHLDGGAA
jgi:transcriptional regulator with XRE-family HTH domain